MNESLQKLYDLIKDIYPSNTAKNVIESFGKKKNKCFWIRYDVETSSVLKSLENQGAKLQILEQLEMYEVTNEFDISHTEEFNNGEIYIQNPSSALSALALEPKKSDYVLDLTAAPGSKTSLIANITKNKANILAIEKSKNRFFTLKNTLEKYNFRAKTYNMDATQLLNKYPEFESFFDKVLLDAPCSSEGTINATNPNTYKYWSQKKIKDMSNNQKRLISVAAKCVKRNGTLVYSTCTINPYENEETVKWILSKNTNLKLEKINIDMENIVSGLEEYGLGIKNSCRILPTNTYQPFYIAKLKKLAIS